MSNKKLLEKARQLNLDPVENESDEDLAARINEAQNSREFDATTAPPAADASQCPDCKGEGIRSPSDLHVCPTCEGSGKV